MSNVYDQTHALARAIKNSDEYKTYVSKKEIVYSNEKKPYYIPIKKKGLRGNSQVNTLNAYVFKEIWSDEKLDFKMLGNVSDQEFLMIAQAFNLNFNLPIDRK